MRAIILAGGRGERLMPLTADRPKCMVEVAGLPIIAHQLRWLARHSVSDVAVSCGHLAFRIEDFVGDGTKFGLKVQYAVEDQALGSGGGLRHAWQAAGWKDHPVIALNGDVITDLPINAMMDLHDELGSSATMAVVPYVTQKGIVDLDEQFHVTAFREKPTLPYLINAGIYVLDARVYRLLPQQGDCETDTWPQLAQMRQLRGFRIYGRWISIDSVKDVTEANSVPAAPEPNSRHLSES